MAYFKIGDTDYSMYVNKLNVNKTANFTSTTNAAGDMRVDYINHKRIIEVGIIPLNDTAMSQLLTDLDAFNVSLSFRNPITNELEENVNCIVPDSSVEYYWIRANNVLYKEFKIKFTEL